MLAALLLAITMSSPSHQEPTIPFGTATNPFGHTITVDATSLRLDGHPWLPMMGEFHFSRYPSAEWKRELLKMKLGGVDIVSTYIFWNHHEEAQGKWNWTGQRNFRQFVKTAGEVGLKVFARIGPWCHGEVRYGGLPDWVIKSGIKTRTNDPIYLQDVTALYAQIFKQVKGLQWKDGGPVMGVQIENEYGGQAAHLLELKKIALAVGFDVPIMTRTGWNETDKPLPFGALLPVFGDYAEGFWDRELTTMPGDYWRAFTFQNRPQAPILQDPNATTVDSEALNRYPFLTCELGGGMETSYHRRIYIDPMDAYAMAVVKLGSGNNLPGFYMYHGGTNPDGKTTLQESQATDYWNDVPVKSYDFQTALGEFGQVRPQYHLLRLLSLFDRDFGSQLAPMTAIFPSERPTTKTDADTLRWTLRKNGLSGFLFFNNYQRALDMPAKTSNFTVDSGSKGETIEFPVPANQSFFFPIHFPIGDADLAFATAQPICRSDDGSVYIFRKIPDVPATFSFKPGAKLLGTTGIVSYVPNAAHLLIDGVPPSRKAAITLKDNKGHIRKIVLLSPEDSLGCYKAEFKGQKRIFLTHSNLIVQPNTFELESNSQNLRVSIYPPVPGLSGTTKDGIFQKLSPKAQKPLKIGKPKLALLQPEGRPRTIKLGSQGVAESPVDADFQEAAIYKIALPQNLPKNCLLRITYVGDVARLYSGGKLLTDNFYNGKSFEIGLDRYQKLIAQFGLVLKILPLQPQAPIYFDPRVRANFPKVSPPVSVKLEIIPHYTSKVTLK